MEDKIEETEKKREEKIRQVEKEFSKQLRPLYDERIKACAKIKGFWVNTMGLHVSDALVFSRGVAQQLEAQAEVLSLPFNLQVVSPSPPFLLRACSRPCDSE